jgi:hypothetical protein
MSSNKVAVKAPAPGAVVSAEQMAKRKAAAGLGASTSADDNLVPLISILQGLSPQVNKRDDKYVEGAEPGDILLKNAPSPLVKGSEGFVFQPCFFSHEWLEWVPRDDGGGFVGRRPYSSTAQRFGLPDDAKQVDDPKNPRVKRWVRAGTEFVDNRSYAGYVQTKGGWLPFILPFSGTGHTAARQLMFLINSKMLPDSSGVEASFAYVYRLPTIQRKNKLGTWFVLDPRNERVATDEEFDRGYALHMAFASGKKAAEAPEGAEEEAAPPF